MYPKVAIKLHSPKKLYDYRVKIAKKVRFAFDGCLDAN
jgi:hypothetical protein